MYNFWEELDWAIELSVDFECENCPVTKYCWIVDRQYIPECHKGKSCGEALQKIANIEVTQK